VKTLTLLVLMIGMFFVAACDDDPSSPPPPPPQSGELNLTQRWHVLNNIEYAYQARRPDVYDELLNADFTFFFSPGDVGGGIPETWSRTEDLEATTRLFNSNQQSDPPADPVCRSMRLDLVYDKDAMTWIEIEPDDFPGEKWYTTTNFYSFTFEMEPNTTYIAQNGAKAQFTLRNAGTEQNPHWELVEFRDLGSTALRSVPLGQASTWGSIKSLYTPSS
jgi:hypothetical protein